LFPLFKLFPRARALALSAAIGLCVALFGLNVSGGFISPPSAEAASPTAPGIHIETWGTKKMATEAERDAEIRRLRNSGARWVRVIALWSALETGGKGVWNEEAFGLLDEQLRRLRAAGLNVVLVAGPGTRSGLPRTDTSTSTTTPATTPGSIIGQSVSGTTGTSQRSSPGASRLVA